MVYAVQTPSLGFPSVGTVVTDSSYNATAKLGDIIRANDPVYGTGEFIYLSGAANTVVGSWVTYNSDNNSTTLLAANAIGPVAIAMAATVAGTAGWYQIQGKAVGLALAAFADDANVYATATAGSVDDAIVAGDRVKNAKGASAVGTPSAGLAEFEIARPWMDDALAA